MVGNGRLKIGFVGAGNVVRSMHLPILVNMKDKFEVVGLADVDHDKARSLSEQFGVGRAYHSFEEMKADNPDMDVVTIATRPYSTHAPLAIEALKAGCHTYVEKPFTVSLSDAREMFTAAQESGRTLCAYQNRRFEVSFLVFRQAIKEGIVGEPRLIRRRVSAGIKPSDLLDFGSHIIDQMICITDGKTPKEVSAVIQHPEAAYDGPAGFFKLSLRYEDGMLGEVERLPNPGKIQINYHYVAGTEGSYRQDWADSMADLFRKQMMLDCKDKMWLPGSFEELFPGIFRRDGSLYYMCYQKFYEHIVGGEGPPVSKEDTLLQFAIVEAMFKSAREKRAVELSAP